MRKRRNPFQVKRSGYPIEEHAIKNRVDSRIEYAQKYAEFASCRFMGMNIERWQSFGYSNELKADVIAFWRLHGMVGVNQQDAKNKKEERLSKR